MITSEAEVTVDETREAKAEDEDTSIEEAEDSPMTSEEVSITSDEVSLTPDDLSMTPVATDVSSDSILISMKHNHFWNIWHSKSDHKSFTPIKTALGNLFTSK